jgi:hypothetical protein
MVGLELAGHRLGGAQRHQAGLQDGPAPATEVQRERRADKAGLLEPEGTRTTTRRMGQQRDAEAMGWMARNTGLQRPTAAAGQGRRRRSRQPLRAPRWMGQCWCGARSCHGSACLADSACVVVVPLCSCTPQRPMGQTYTWFWGRLAS